MTDKWRYRHRSWLLALVVVLAGCSSIPTDAPQPRQHEQHCECGTPEHDVLGCTHECCRGGPECGNPLCLCPTIVRSPGDPRKGEQR